MNFRFNNNFNNNFNNKPIPKQSMMLESNRIILKSYNEPIITDMAVLLVYFNPCNYNRIIQNALTVKHLFDSANIPYFITEIQFNENKFFFIPADNIFQYRSNSYMFYKENLITTMEKRIPEKFTKICIIDFDIFFDNSNWYSIISEKLNSVSVTQPFMRLYYLNLDYTILNVKTNSLDNKTTNPIDYALEHSGFIWAFDRTWLNNYNLDDKYLTAMGDSILANNITKRSYYGLGEKLYYKYSSNKPNLEKINYDSCNLNIYHLNHGSINNRQYSSINQIFYNVFIKFKINCIDDVYTRREDNILEWSPKYITVLNDIMLKYFNDRLDDT